MTLILLDRDGVINEDREDFVKSPEEFRLIENAAQSIAQMNERGWKIAVVTNQSCIGRGIITEAQLYEIHQHMIWLLHQKNAFIDKIYFAPDHPDQAGPRRKPGPGMLLEAMRDFAVKPQNTFMIGDALRDLEAAKAAECHRFLIATGRGSETLQQGLPTALQPVMLAKDLSDATTQIIKITA